MSYCRVVLVSLIMNGWTYISISCQYTCIHVLYYVSIYLHVLEKTQHVLSDIK